MLDAHQHFWLLDRGDYGWLGPHLAPLYRDFGPADLRSHMVRAGITRTIVVQAAQTESETDYLLALAQENDFIAGVVGWLDMEADNFAERLAYYRQNPLFVGLRPMLQELAKDDWICHPRVLANLCLVANTELAFDILSFPQHLPYVQKALEQTPQLRAVVDHISKPDIHHHVLEPWKQNMSAIAAMPQVSCKLSGLVTQADPQWCVADFEPYVDHVVKIFGEDRLLFGSDWPVCTLSGSYAEVVNLLRTLLARHFGADALAKVFEGNAARLYRV